MSRRIRKHANPFQVLNRLGRLDRLALFGREAALEVDIGCGAGGFLFERAREDPSTDFVGLEIRRPLVEQATERRQGHNVKNVVFLYANANTNLGDLAAPGVVRRFTVHFPDPCFKKRHRKRRILQPGTVRDMARLLRTGGEVFAQSDVRPLAEEMFDFLRAESAFESRLAEDLSAANPFHAKTEWERQHEKEGEPIYRMLFVKVREPSGPIPDFELRDTHPDRCGAQGKS